MRRCFCKVCDTQTTCDHAYNTKTSFLYEIKRTFNQIYQFRVLYQHSIARNVCITGHLNKKKTSNGNREEF